MEKIKVILCDDHKIVRDGIKALVESMDEMIVIGEASSAEVLLEDLHTLHPDVIILDISLPGKSGIEVASIIKERFPEIKILFLSMYNDEDFVFNAIKSGASGYLPKNTSCEELKEAIISVFSGQEYFSDSISKIILKSYVAKAKSQDEDDEKGINALSKREQEVLKLFVEGKSNKEIADELFISIRTVESHKNHIMTKLELNTNVDLIKFAIKNQIIEL
ncbi:response regulator [Bacteroidota bacterium]